MILISEIWGFVDTIVHCSRSRWWDCLNLNPINHCPFRQTKQVTVLFLSYILNVTLEKTLIFPVSSRTWLVVMNCKKEGSVLIQAVKQRHTSKFYYLLRLFFNIRAKVNSMHIFSPSFSPSPPPFVSSPAPYATGMNKPMPFDNAAAGGVRVLPRNPPPMMRNNNY